MTAWCEMDYGQACTRCFAQTARLAVLGAPDRFLTCGERDPACLNLDVDLDVGVCKGGKDRLQRRQ